MKIETIEIAGLAGALTALRLPFGKEMIDTTGFCWKDILAAMLGCLLVEAAAVFGVLMGV